MDPLGENTYKRFDPNLDPRIERSEENIGFHLQGGMYGAAIGMLLLVSSIFYHAVYGAVHAVVAPQVHRLFIDTSHLEGAAAVSLPEGAGQTMPPVPAQPPAAAATAMKSEP